jgi:hypothetical protein
MSVPSASSAEAFWLLHQFKYSKIETHIQHLIRKDPGANIQDQRFRKNSQHSKIKRAMEGCQFHLPPLLKHLVCCKHNI